MCAFTVGDLDVQGELANSVIAVAEVLSPANTGVSRDEACDIFVLLDPRPFGLKPHLLFLHHDIVHIPTVVALLGLPTSSAFKVGVSGGTKLGDRVRVSGNVSLLLFPEAKTYEDVAEESSSSSSVSQLVPPWEDEAEPTDDTAPAEVWGPPPGLTFEGVTVVDPTIPPGQSWNEESVDSMPTYTVPVQAETVATSGSPPPWDTFDGQPPLPPPNDPPEVTSPPSTSGLIAALQVQALVYVPDFVPEVVEISLDIPTAVQAACETVQDARLAYQSSSFPYLCAAVPQPAPAFAVFVAAPLWQNGTAVVLFDCLGYDGTLFAKSVHCRLSRESLLLAAGLPHDAAVHVYLRGSLHHLGIDQRTTLTTGDTVQIVRRGILPGTCHYLEDRLGTVELWNRNAELPGPRTHFNGCFQILSEGAPFPFLVRPDGYSSFKKDLASSVGSDEHRLTLKTSVPRIVDSYPFGYWASGVIVATEALSRVPYPPARHHETRRILILDQRRILQGFSWRLVSGRVVPVQDVVGPFAASCPFGHTVLAHGAPTEQHGEEPAFIIQHGQVLTIEYRPVQEGGDVPASPWSDHAQHVPGTQQGMLFDRGDGDRHSGPSTGRTVSGNDRTATRLLGCEWPFPPYRWPIGFFDDDSDEPMSDHEGLGVQVDVTFYLLTPGHTPEKVEMTVILPQIVQDILDLVDICRDSVRKSLYPGLIVVEPQPDPGARRFGTFNLSAMLTTHLPWEHSPVFPRDTLGNGYCANLETFLASLPAPDDLTSEGSDDELSRHEVDSTSNIVVPASPAPSASVAIGTGQERRLGVLALCCLFGLIALLPGEVFSSCAVGLCVFAVGGHPYLPALYLWHFLIGGGHLPVTAMQQPPWRGEQTSTREGEVCEFGGKVDTLWRRPVATPCRSRNAALGPLFHQEKDGGRHRLPEPIQEDTAPWREPLVTLLEESSRRDDNWAFLAATLLDTLLDHFQTIGEQKAPQRTPVSLAHHLPTAQIHDLTAVSFDFGVSFATAGQLVQPHSWILGHSVPSWLARDAGADLLCAAPSGCASHDEDLHIYTDGSFDGSCSSWAFAVIAHRNNSQRLAGWAAGRTVVDVEVPASDHGFPGDFNMHFATPIPGHVGDKVFPSKHEVPDAFV
ncbi:unnamed protein product, partial [Symbiodinium microadriaticum]